MSGSFWFGKIDKCRRTLDRFSKAEFTVGHAVRLQASGGLAFRKRGVPSLRLHQVFIEDPNGVAIELNHPAAPLLHTTALS